MHGGRCNKMGLKKITLKGKRRPVELHRTGASNSSFMKLVSTLEAKTHTRKDRRFCETATDNRPEKRKKAEIANFWGLVRFKSPH